MSAFFCPHISSTFCGKGASQAELTDTAHTHTRVPSQETVMSPSNGVTPGPACTDVCMYIYTFWRRKWQPTPVFLPGESQGQRSLVGCHLRVAQSQTRLKRLSSSSIYTFTAGQRNLSGLEGHGELAQQISGERIF